MTRHRRPPQRRVLSRRPRVAAGILVGVLILGGSAAGAAGDTISNDTITTTTVVHDDDSDVVGVGIGGRDTVTPGTPGGSDGDVTGGPAGSGGSGDGSSGSDDECSEGWWRNPTTGRVDTWVDSTSGDIVASWYYSCPFILTLETRFYRDPTPADLIPGFYGAVLAQIQPPHSAINPADEAPINLGLWLATDGPTEIVESGVVGPFEVSVTATLVDTTFDLGDGTVVTCAGGGVAISDLDTVEQGPCGHTYTADLPDGAVIAMRGRWQVRYDTTIGSGTLPDVGTDAAVAYATYEIQTVGGERD